jgi:hypothetical protein
MSIRALDDTAMGKPTAIPAGMRSAEFCFPAEHVNQPGAATMACRDLAGVVRASPPGASPLMAELNLADFLLHPPGLATRLMTSSPHQRRGACGGARAIRQKMPHGYGCTDMSPPFLRRLSVCSAVLRGTTACHEHRER